MALTPVPLGVVTLILPLLAPDGTVNLILVGVSLLIAAPTPSIVTELASSNAFPVMVTLAPTAPEVGLKLASTGAGTVTLPMALVRLMNHSAPSGPVVMPSAQTPGPE